MYNKYFVFQVFLYRERLKFLKLHTADMYQYLIIKYIDGNITHKRGYVDFMLHEFFFYTLLLGIE
jgi:hypothetical protein